MERPLDNDANVWTSFSSTRWIGYDFGQPKKIQNYFGLIKPPRIPRSRKNRILKKFAKKMGFCQIQASNDQLNWIKGKVSYQRRGKVLIIKVKFPCDKAYQHFSL